MQVLTSEFPVVDKSAVIEPEDDVFVLPTSFAQQRLWFLDLLAPNSCAYNLIAAVRVSGLLKVEILERSVAEIVRRHEVLRTTFATVEGEARQIITSQNGISLRAIDLREEGEAEQERRVREEVAREAQTPFNLRRGPLMRLTVLQQSESEHVLLLAMHHIISDGWSMRVMINELSQLYAAYVRGEQSPLPELGIQYADYAMWQRERLQGEVLNRQLDYWREQLRGAPAVLELPTDRPRTNVQSLRGATEVLVLDEELSEGLKQISRQHGVTLFITLLAAFQTLLSRYCGTPDVVVGSPIANRNRDEIEGLIGFFVNTLVFRARIEREESFSQMLKRVREVCLEAYAHQDVPFEKLVEALQLERSMSYQPLVQVLFALQNATQQTQQIDGLRFKPIELETKSSRCDLTVSIIELGSRMEAQVEYSTDLFDAATIRRMLGHFTNLLESIVADPEQRVGELRMLSADEERQVVEEWNDTQREYARETCIHELFAEEAQRRPDAVAVVADGEQVSYGELNRRANQLAWRLQELGVGPEVVVGICVERSVELIVGLLGILKAGGAYLPLDAEYPRERLEYMVADAGVNVVLTQSSLRDRLPLTVDVQYVELESDSFVRGDSTAPESGASAETLAYVIYTSGSTGQPKGAAVPHRGVVRLVRQSNYVKLDEEQVVLQMAPVSFDASTFEIWGALLNGARLVMMQAGQPSLEDIAATVKQHQVSTMWLTAGLFQVMATEQLESLREVKQLLAGGDVLGVRAVQAVLEGTGEHVLINGYGPTENTTFSCCHVMHAGEEVGVTVPIGKPITNSTAYVLDEQLRPVPVGVRGELYLGGDGLARGYVGQPELTAQRFIPNPFSKDAGARLYRTGDVVRWNSQGVVEFIGRVDHQVKVRGYRIELGEVEEALAGYEGISESAVVVRSEGEGDKRLVGYVVSAADVALEVSELRSYLETKLPDYMIPSVFVELTEFPLTANGKVDRKALAAEELELGGKREYEAPRTAVEELLAGIWAEVLGVDRVGIHDNFFELGGDSILSIQSIARANRAGLRLSPKDLFQHQTVALLAAVAGTATEVIAEQGLVTGPVALTPIQHWFFEQELSEPHHFNQTLLLEVKEALDPQLLAEAVRQIVLHHDALRLRFEQSESGWIQYHADATEPASFTKLDLSTVPASRQSAAIEAEAAAAQASLNVTAGPVLRVVYFDMGEEQPARLLLVCHHLVVDGVSWRILLADLQEAYGALAAGVAVQLPAKSSSFQQWSQALQEYAGRSEVQAQVEYWQSAQREQVRSLPRDYADGENLVNSTAVVVESLSREETEALLQEVPGVYHTQINEVLLSGLALAIGEWSESPVVLADVEGHGREEISERVDVSRTVGWFTTIYPVLLEVNGGEAGEVVKQIKEQVREIPGQGLGYGVLRYLGEAGERLRALPQAEVSFNYLGQIDRVLNEETLFGAARESSGSYRSETGRRSYLVEINAMVAGGQLQVSWSYSTQVHRQETIAKLATAYVQSLRTIIEHCRSEEAGGYTPSDFPLAQLSASELPAVVRDQRQGIADVYPLSPMQAGLLFHSLYAPQGGLYVEQVQNLFRGALDLEALRTAWERVQERHAILRSSFRWEGLRRPVQVVAEQSSLQWHEEDWRGLSREQQEAGLREFLRVDRERGFEMNHGPLHRYQVLRLGESEWQLVWSFHHILLDGWCLSLVLQEVYGIYEALVRGAEAALGRPRSYRDYIAWLQQQDLEAAKNYWTKRLAGFRAPTQLGLDSAASNEAKSYGEQNLELSSESTRALEALAREQQVTLNTVVQGAWAVLLSRYSGERDVVYGVTVSGRPAELAGVEQMIGLFINTLPLRVEVESAVELGAWLQRLQAEQADMRQYEYSPLVEVQGWSEVERGVALFETLLAFENYPVTNVTGEQRGSESEVQYAQEWAMERTNYPLTLLVGPGERLKLRGLHEEQRYSAETVSRVLGHLKQVLVSMADSAQQQVGDLRMLSASEARQVVTEWNETQREYAREACIHELFAEQAQQRPDAVAVIADGKQVSYGELNARANKLAWRLQELGVGPEVVVGICAERSVELIVGLLGILKAGGAYLPLDADYPQERLEYMVADAGVSVLLTQSSLRDRLPVSADVQCLELDSDSFVSGDGIAPESGASAETLAYVIYTSGSTGQPKGVAVPHRGVVRLVQHSNYVKLDEEQVVLQMAPVSFDASTFEIWGALLNGARLVMMQAGQPSLEEIAATVKRHQVSTMWLTAGLFQVMATEQLESLREVKQLLAGGDVLGVRAVQAVLDGEGERVLINGYGPTENTTFSCCHVMHAGDEVRVTVPIGKPITNSTAYVLDEQLRPVPVGVRGELYLGGDGLARGYLGSASLTAQRFIPNPFSTDAGARLYRTGDVVRWNSEGVVEFIGRADHQVKVRGYRIELGEVEEALAGYEGISESVVIVRTEGDGDKRLVGYVVAAAGVELEVSELRAYLETKLPDYMIPSVFVELTELPLTANGKVDRKALAAEELEFEGKREYEAPRTEVERILSGIWASVLGLERAGSNDNFFELGGHSLMATQVISRVRETFKLELPLRTLFEAPQLSDFAEAVERAMREEQQVEAPPMVPVSRERTLPLSFAQQRLWFLDQLDPMSNAYNIPAVVRLRGPFTPEFFKQALEEVIRRHESLRTRFVMDQGRASQEIDEAIDLNVPLFDLTELSAGEQNSEVRRMTSEEASKPFDLAFGPLLRLTVLRLAENDHVLLLTVHHIISDGWSMSLLMRELTALYDAFSRGESSPLPELPVQYADYAVWQREWLQGEVLDQHMKYWREQLQGAPPVLELPTDHPRPAVQSLRGRMLHRQISDDLREQLQAVGRREGLTLYMSVLAAFVVVLARYSGEHEIVVGTPIAGRTRREIEGLIGFFVNTLVLRTRVDEQESVQQLLGRVRETCLGAYTHQDVPFEQLVEELQPERDLSRQPLFQVMFALEDGGDEQEWTTDNLQVEVEGVESEVAKFDLTLRVLPRSTGCELSIEYQQDLYEEATIARMLEHVERVLAEMVADVLQPVSELTLLTEAERVQVLGQWNDTERKYANEICVQQLFEARAAERPEALALVSEGEQLSYGELNRRSNQLAHFLRELGVGPDVVVGLCVDRSVEMVVGLLGILKAGGAYLPLDPTYPQQRLAFMRSDASLSLLLTKEALLPALPAGSVQTLCLDSEQDFFAHCPEENIDLDASSLNLAYVIYTSGSTGTPKGVQIQHRALVNFLDSMRCEPGLTADDYLLAVTSLSFDIAALEIFLPLTCGARVEVVSRELAAQGALLKQRLIDSHATVMQATPATWRLLAAAGLDGLDGLQRWCGGEALNRDLANQLADNGAVVWNLYGPTETTIWSGLWQVKPGSESVLIGRPIANTQFYVLDERLRPVPIGVPGELYIGGDGVARGYMNRPELTSERFVPDPFGGGTKLYRTGDTVRWRAEGELEYLERRDQQVKVRGYRIELGEIEAVLNEHPSVKESVAAVKDDEAGNKKLVAYVVQEAGSQASASELRQKVRERLPEYMVPQQLIKLDSIPLTPNGKVDRKRLPDVEGTALAVNQYVAPRTTTEATLAEIWQRVLMVDRVGINDNFFELGGDSIVSIQIIAQAKEVGLQLTPKDLFQHQTIATLLEAIEFGGTTMAAEQGLVMGPVSLTPIQHWFFLQELTEPNQFNQSVLLELRPVDAHLLADAAQQLLLHHDALRLRFERSASGWNQYHVDAAEAVSFTKFDFSAVPANKQSAAIEAEAAAVQASLNVSEGPLVRFVYFDLGEGQPARLLVVCHHLVVDGVSWRILLEDLQRICASLMAGEKVQLPAKTTSYQQWAEAVSEYAARAAVQQQSTYWLAAQWDEVRALPRDYEGGGNLIQNTAVVAVSLTRTETEALLQEVPGVYHTQINEVLLSALAVALGEWTGQATVLVDMEGHGREPISDQVDVSRTVGWFTTIYPVLLQVRGRLSEVAEVVKQVKEQVRSIPEQGLGYGMLRYLGAESEAKSRLRALPQAEVVFNYTGQFDQALSESGLFRVGQEERGEGRSAANQRAHLLEVTGGVAGGQLQLTWSYSEEVHTRETVERVAADFIAALRQLIQQCQWGEGVGFTPSDFPEARLSQKDLDKFLTRITGTNEAGVYDRG